MAERQQHWRYISALIGTRRILVALLALASFLGGLVEAGFLVIVTRTALSIADGKSRTGVLSSDDLSVNRALALAAGLLACRLFLALWSSWAAVTVVTDVGVKLRKRLTLGYLNSSWATQQAERSGRLQELVVSYAGAGAGLVSSFTTAIIASLNLIAMIVVSLAIDPKASLAVIVALVLLGSAIAPLRRRIKTRSRRAAEAGMNFATSISELGSLGLEMQAFGARQAFQQRIVRLIDTEASERKRVGILQGGIGPIYTFLAYAALVAAVAMATLSGVTELSSIGAVMLVMLRSLSYGQSLQGSSANMVSVIPFLETLDTTMDRYEASPAPGGGVSINAVNDLVATNLSFAYSPTSEPVLRDLSFTIPRGSVVGIIGPSGSGKSTLVQLLLGLREAVSGQISANGIDLRTIDRQVWATKVAFVPQEALLFSGSIAENIGFFRDFSDVQIRHAAARAHLDDDIANLPDGYDSNVGERGGRLSGGQRQRLAIARALIGEPEVLILDEPTSALDMTSESAIRATLSELAGRTTVVIIAHRLTTLEMCDQLMVIQDGELKAIGTHQQLSDSDPFYREALRLSGMA
jgi:ATP-binding cassette, subfamily B, bacterial